MKPPGPPAPALTTSCCSTSRARSRNPRSPMSPWTSRASSTPRPSSAACCPAPCERTCSSRANSSSDRSLLAELLRSPRVFLLNSVRGMYPVEVVQAQSTLECTRQIRSAELHSPYRRFLKSAPQSMLRAVRATRMALPIAVSGDTANWKSTLQGSPPPPVSHSVPILHSTFYFLHFAAYGERTR